ncbi:MAG: BlaI/MecI/CopY family transcriptional regulator [bacterium]|nr:BlaI/MecI/CopY family transcriptional regulator [bacterium]
MGRSLLTNAELAVLELLWEQGDRTARQIREQLYPEAEKAQHGTAPPVAGRS